MTEAARAPLPYRTALVTGASRGIGAAICRRLADLGLTVYGIGRTAAALQELARTCGAVPIVADLRDMTSIATAIAGLEIDVLVNNAGAIASVKPLHEQSEDDIVEMVALNLTAPLLLTRLVVPGMIERRRGHVVNITSTAAHHVFPGTAVYGATKAALSHAGRVLRYDLAGTRVRLTEIAPGRVATDIYLQSFSGDRNRLRDTMYARVRAMEPLDIAEAVAATVSLPSHVDVSMMEIVPTDQASGGYIYPETAD